MEASRDIPAPERRADYAPEGTETGTGTFATLKRTLTEFSEDNMTDWAAALTYYGLLSLFPSLIALVSILGIFGDPATTTKAITDIVTKLGPGSAAQTFAGPIKQITESKSAAGILFFVGLGTALWSASGYVGALQILVTLVMIILLAAVLLALVLTGPVVDAVAGPIGLGSTAVSIWNIAKWPVLLVVVIVMFSVLFYAAPNVKVPRGRWVSPGAILAVVVWIIVSVLFAFYVANFGSYNKTYGTLGGMVALLVWMWITNISLLLGMQLNAERERSRELKAGVPRAEREIQLEPRDEPKVQKTT
jgi:membrane protein